MLSLRRCFLVVLLVIAGTAAHAQIVSDFAGNADGWTTPNDADGTIGFTGVIGNPPGSVFGSPFSFNVGATTIYVPYYFIAPGKFLGNRSAYYNGTLRYDVQQSSTNTSDATAEVVMHNNAGIGIYYYPTTPFQPAATPTWTNFTVVLNNASGFWKTTDSPTGPPATEALLQSVIVNLVDLQIRGLYRQANVTARLDNVTLYPPIIINTQPSSSAVCNGVTATFTTAASNNAAITYRWQRESSPGVYTDIVNGGGYSNATTATLSVNTTGNFGAGNYRARISGTAVVDAFTNIVSLTINAVPAAPTTTGNSRCGSGTVTLSASGGTAGQYRWYTVPTLGTPIAGQTAATYTTPVITLTTTYYVAINNGTCESTRTPVIATVNTPPAAPTGTDGSRCGSGTVTLSASGGAAGQYRWYTVPTLGTPIAGQTNASYTTPSLTSTTPYYVAINNGTCESTRTTVVATINTVPAAPTGTGGSRCGSGTVTLSASGGTAGQYRWYTVPTLGTPIAGQTNATYTTPSLTSTTTYYVAINNGTCESTRTTVIATINTVPAAPTGTGGFRCGSGTVTLSASGGTAGQYRWYTVPTLGTPIAGQTNDTYTTPVLTATTTYYVAINNGTCESTRTAVIATISSPPSAPTGIGATVCGPGTATLGATGGTAGQYRWYTVSSGGSPIPGETNSSYTTPALSSTTTYYVAINNACESPRTAVVATIATPPSAPSGTGATVCTGSPATLTASGGTAGQYRWYTVATGGTPVTGQNNSTYTTPALNVTTSYYVSINDGVCEGSRVEITATVTGPTAPSANPTFFCPGTSATLTATGGTNGQYRWYSVATGGGPITGQVNSTYTTPVLPATTIFYVAINDGTCESTRTAVTATSESGVCNNHAPVIGTAPASTQIGGTIQIDLFDLITDADNNLDLTTLTIVTPPNSGAQATIVNNTLFINYTGISFTGTENITLRVCDIYSACTQQSFAIQVDGSIAVYNAISPGNDGKNDVFFVQNIDKLSNTRQNHVAIYNRWGDLVWEADNYNNTSVAFIGKSKNGAELPSGTYFYKIDFGNDKDALTGYLVLKR